MVRDRRNLALAFARPCWRCVVALCWRRRPRRRKAAIRSRSASAWRSPAPSPPTARWLLAALEIWRDDVNAKGGLLGRPVELVYYDDQSNPANVPGIYTKLISVDKVDLLLGPYATNMIAPAMPLIMQQNKMTIGLLGVGINRHFKYPRYFSMLPLGPDGVNEFSDGFFDDGRRADPEAADGRDPRRRCRVRPHRGGRRARDRQGARLRHRLRQGLSAEHHRLRAGRSRRPGDQSRSRVRRRLSARHGRHRAGRERGQSRAEDVRRRDGRAVHHARSRCSSAR